MKKYIDLSHTIVEGIPAHPYDDQLKLYRNRFLEQNEFNDSKIETGMHVGTHLDAPSHLLDMDIFISDYPLTKFVGEGCLLDVREQDIIPMQEEYWDWVKEDNIVLLYTGFGQNLAKDDYFTNHPIITMELAEFFVQKGIKMLGMDLPSPDKYPFEVHKLLLSHDILLMENLTKLEELLALEQFKIMAFPLKIKAEASPVRVIAEF